MKQFKTIIFLFLIWFLSSCATQQELRAKKVIRAQKKIKSLVTKFPELKSTKDTTYHITDTTIVTNTKYINDSIFIQGGITVDTVLQIADMDSIFTAYSKDIELQLTRLENGQTRATVSVVPHYIYETDTLHTVDTVFRERLITQNTEIVDVKESFWWNLWFTVKGWLWYILIILGIIVIIVIVLRVLKTYFTGR